MKDKKANILAIFAKKKKNDQNISPSVSEKKKGPKYAPCVHPNFRHKLPELTKFEKLFKILTLYSFLLWPIILISLSYFAINGITINGVEYGNGMLGILIGIIVFWGYERGLLLLATIGIEVASVVYGKVFNKKYNNYPYKALFKTIGVYVPIIVIAILLILGGALSFF